MDERIIIAMVSAVGFLIIAFTPIVPLMLHTYDVDNVYITKAVIGIASLICGYGIFWGLFKKKDQIPQKKEGKIRVKPILLLVGIIVISLAWFTDIPIWLSDWTGLSNTFTYKGDTLSGGLGLRLWVSILTGLGVLFIKLSVNRDKEKIYKVEDETGRESKYMDLLNKKGEGGVAW